MGVSGSGKTAVGKALAARLGWTFEDADDRHPPANVEKMRTGVPLTDEDRRPWLRGLSEAIGAWVSEGCHVVLACSALRKWHRDALRSGVADGGSIRFVYLKGTYDQIERRLPLPVRHFMPGSLLPSQFDAFEEPDAAGALIVPGRPPVRALLDAV